MALFRFLLIAACAIPLHLPLSGHAQDSPINEALRSADWNTDRVAEGVVWRQAHLTDLYGLPQSLNVLKVDLDAEKVSVDVAFSDTGRVRTSVLAGRTGAIAAVNGSFFDMSNGESVAFFQSDGQVLQATSETGERFEGAVAVEPEGDAAVLRKAEPRWTRLPRFEDVLASGPLLVWEGDTVPSEDVGFNFTHHPRTALGTTEDNHLLLVTVDGRTNQAAGMTIRELAWVMQGLGTTMAINLDGGGSTTMWLREEGVVNYPSGSGTYDHEGERPVANAVVVRVEE